MAEEEKLTPMMVQYRQIKEQNPDSVLFFRLGDFYEMFEEDASSLLFSIYLTKRNHKKIGGIPYHAAKTYSTIADAAEDSHASKPNCRKEASNWQSGKLCRWSHQRRWLRMIFSNPIVTAMYFPSPSRNRVSV